MLSDFIKPEYILLNVESNDKDSLFREMTEVLVRAGTNIDRDDVVKALYEREQQMNTCIMKGVAVPHGICSSVTKPLIAVGISQSGIDYDIEGVSSKDFNDSLIHLVFMMLFEKDNTEKHLHILADCARVLYVPEFYTSLLRAKSSQDVCNIIKEYESSR